MRKRHLLFFALILACTAGCSILNPYDAEFPCKGSYGGKCSSVRNSHMESLSGMDNGVYEKLNPPPCEGEDCMAVAAQRKPSTEESRNVPDQRGDHLLRGSEAQAAEAAYKTSLYKRLDSLLQEPKMPVVAPPKVMRILMLPYKGQEGEFYMMRHLYFFVDEPRWILGDNIDEMIE